MNLLAAVAIGFLVFDPEQMFEASFQLSFLSVAFLAAFAVPWIERTSGPMARALSDLTDATRDPRFTGHAAQFRVEMRLLAETVTLATRLPERWASFAIAAPARIAFFFHDLIVTSAVIQFGLAPLMALYFHRVSFSGLSANVFVVPLLGLVVPVGSWPSSPDPRGPPPWPDGCSHSRSERLPGTLSGSRTGESPRHRSGCWPRLPPR